jgi:hypothetical protein
MSFNTYQNNGHNWVSNLEFPHTIAGVEVCEIINCRWVGFGAKNE